MIILYLPRFARQYKKLPQNIKRIAQDKEKIFRKNPFEPSLKTHKLQGSLEGLWAFSINHSYRIIFEFENPSTVRWYSIGNHDIYDQF